MITQPTPEQERAIEDSYCESEMAAHSNKEAHRAGYLAGYLAGRDKDTQRLDKLQKLRRHYSRPPMRAVTGWEWSVVAEGGEGLVAAEDVRAAIDNLPDPS